MASESRKTKRERQYEEINEYRDLLQAPQEFESGFTKKTLLGVLFIAFIMTPGQMYLGLVTGIGIGDAAQWVTVILFLEIAKRSFTTLRRQEIFLLTYVASQLIVRAETQTFLQLIWRQYFVGSPEAAQFGLTDKLVSLKWMGYGWFSPAPDSEAIIQRTFFHVDWALPIALLVIGIIVGRVTWFTSGYVLFRLISDREQLPFPTAPQAALGAMALAEESGSEEQTWKWPCFTIGGSIGLVFGFIYVAIPALTETFTGTKVTILPIPFADLTPVLGRYFGATPIAIPFSLSPIFAGLLLPFWSVMGSFAAVVSFIVLSPMLHHYGFMPHWVPGMGAIQTQITAGVDFWQPFGMGTTLAVAIISVTQVIRAGRERREDLSHAETHGRAPDTCMHPECSRPSQVRGYCMQHLNRGDFPVWICVSLFFVGAAYPIFMAKTLFPTLVTTGMLVLILVIAFIYAPLMSFVSARLDGLIGQNIQIPHLHEATVFLTGYRGVEIWFVPLAGTDFGGNAETFRIIELTGMRFTSLLKAELVMVPIVLGASLMYWSFLWKLAPIPSEAYPYVQTFWPARAFGEAVKYSATQYSVTYVPGEEVEGETVPPGQVVWSPANLQDKSLYYWRVRISDEVQIRNPDLRSYGPWSATGYFYTDFTDAGGQRPTPLFLRAPADKKRNDALPQLQLLTPADGSVVREAETMFRAGLPPPAAPGNDGGDRLAPEAVPAVLAAAVDEALPGGAVTGVATRTQDGGDALYVVDVTGADGVLYEVVADGDGSVQHRRTKELEYLFELDTDPAFRGDFFQSSLETPMFFQIYWRDPKSTGDGKDDDFDGVADEEVLNQKDDDGDGAVDEDLRHPTHGEKWPILAVGLVFGLGLYTFLGFFGMPMFFVWGYIRAVASAGAATFFAMFTEFIGALIAKYYFWPRYGRQQWRQYAMVLAVGFGVGMSLVGMFCAATLMIAKAVSATTF